MRSACSPHWTALLLRTSPPHSLMPRVYFGATEATVAGSARLVGRALARGRPLLAQDLVAIEELGLVGHQRLHGAADDHGLGARGQLEWIAAPHDDVGDPAALERAALRRAAEDLRRDLGDRGEALGPRQALRDRDAGELADRARRRRAADRRDSDRDAGLGEDRRVVVAHVERAEV